MLNPGDRIGDWIVDAKLGEGGMGAVFRCHNVLSERITSAVKILKSHDLGESRQRFIREVELVATVRHPAVVQVMGAGEDTERGLVWMAMELLDGEELTDRLARGPLSWEEAASMFKVLGEGLLAAHERGVVHRDIKPPNIMILKDGTPKLLDFGIATQQGATKLTKEGLVPGTIAYIAPEVFEGEVPDHRADIYALGLVLWESLTGKEAFPEDGQSSPGQSVVRIMGEKLRSKPMDPGDKVPRPIRDLVQAATDPEVDTRLSHLEEFVRVLGETDAHGVGPSVRRPTRRGRSWVGVAVGGTLAVVLILGLVLLVGGLVIGGVGVGVVAMRSSPPGPVTAEASPTNVSSSSSGIPTWGSTALPEGFPLSLPDDATIQTAMTNESSGAISQIVMFVTEEDPQALADRYEQEFRGMGLDVTRANSTYNGVVAYTVTAYDVSVQRYATYTNGDYEGHTQITLVWMPGS